MRLFPEAVRRTRNGANRDDPVLTESSLVREVGERAPRGGLNSIQGSLSGEPYSSTGYVERPSSPSSLGTPFWSPNRRLNRRLNRPRKNAAIRSKLPATTSRFSTPASSRTVPHSHVTSASVGRG